jgi:hypothetical protein
MQGRAEPTPQKKSSRAGLPTMGELSKVEASKYWIHSALPSSFHLSLYFISLLKVKLLASRDIQKISQHRTTERQAKTAQIRSTGSRN